MVEIKPSSPLVVICIGLVLVVTSLMLLMSPFLDAAIFSVSVFVFLGGLLFVFLSDYAFMKIQYDNEILTLSGFLGIRKMRLATKEILGYEKHEKADQFNGFHTIIVLVTDERKIPFVKGAYPNYEVLESFVEKRFDYLGHKKLKFGKLFGKLMSIIALLSGLLALLVGIMKLW